jgi:hypothetical protein
MPEKQLKESGKKESIEVTFRCQCCNRMRPLKEMRSVTRFLPVLVVCSECDKALR